MTKDQLSQADPTYICLTQEWDAAWEAFDACYSDGIKDFIHVLQNIPIVAKSDAVKLLCPENLPKVNLILDALLIKLKFL